MGANQSHPTGVTEVAMLHQHRYREHYGDLRADEPGGPRTYHEIWWECACGDVVARDAKRRAQRAQLSGNP